MTLFITAMLLCGIFAAVASNCPNQCKEGGWRPVGRYCVKFFAPVAFFSEADNTCRNEGSSLLSKHSLSDAELRELIKEIHKEFSFMKSHSFWNNGKMYMFGRDPRDISFMLYDDFRDFSCVSEEFCGGKCVGKRQFNNMLFSVHGNSNCLLNAPDGKTKYPVICQYYNHLWNVCL